ncbi:MAG: hypothetical protein U5L09_09435 [Bacteroidales bacterium]|nr:hypothetical protein [Bacteroidales bacterium]
MKKNAILGILFSMVMVIGVTQFYGCEKTTFEDDGIPILPLKPDIINPPDSFKVIFPLSTSGFIGTLVTFDTTSHWYIERQNAYSAHFQVTKINDTLPATFIGEAATLQFEGGTPYEFLATANNHPNPRSLIVIFRNDSVASTLSKNPLQ